MTSNPGFFVQASLPSEIKEKALTVPEQAVNYRYGVYKDFVLNGARVSERHIKPGTQATAWGSPRVEVLEGPAGRRARRWERERPEG